MLLQNSGKQAAIVNAIAANQIAHATLPAARAAKLRWHTLVTRVAGTIEAMPLWKLQTVGGERDERDIVRVDESDLHNDSVERRSSQSA